MPAAYALFLRRKGTIQHDQLRLVLLTLEYRARAVTEKFGPGNARVRVRVHMCMWVVCITSLLA